MLGGGLILICVFPLARPKATATEERNRRFSDESDPFVIGFSPDIKYFKLLMKISITFHYFIQTFARAVTLH